MDPKLKAFISGMPKVELHLHIEGTFEPEMVIAIANRNGKPLQDENGQPLTAEALKAKYRFNNLDEFLALYYQAMGVLKTERDYEDMTYDYLEKARSQNVRHTEMFFDPQIHIDNGVPLALVMEGIHNAQARAGKDLGISSKLILSFVRHKDEQDAFKTLEMARPFIEKGYIGGFGLDSSEKGHPPAEFKRVFEEARKTGLPLVMHAGEEGPPHYVSQALNLIKVARIDHGNRALESPALIRKLAQNKTGLTVCPISNLRLGVIRDMKDHPLKRMLGLGIRASVNSDDPAYFRTDKNEGGYINENFLAVAEALNLSQADVVRLARNAIAMSFMTPEEKTQEQNRLNDYIKEQSKALPERFVSSAAQTQFGIA